MFITDICKTYKEKNTMRMNRQKYKYYTIAIILVLLCALSGCGIISNMGTPGPYLGEETALFTIATFSIPAVCQINTGIDIIEKDDQGRTLFRITGGNSPIYYECFGTQNNLYAFVICQYYDDEKVYYYEDDCYVLYANTTDFDLTEQEQLKNRNDWNHPLDYDRMIEKQIIPKGEQGYKYTTEERKIENGKAKDAFLERIIVDNEDNVFITLFDDDGQGRMLFYIIQEQFISWGKVDKSTIRSYLEIYDTKKGINNAAIVKIEDPEHIWIEIKDFKQQNHWRVK